MNYHFCLTFQYSFMSTIMIKENHNHYLYYPLLEAHEQQNYDVQHWSSFRIHLSLRCDHLQIVASYFFIDFDICSDSSHIGQQMAGVIHIPTLTSALVVHT
jgi:hypothetical protein